MPARVTPESLRAEAEQLEKRAKGLRAMADVLESHAELRDVVELSTGQPWEKSRHTLKALLSDESERTMTGTEMATESLSGEDQRRLGIAKARGGTHAFQLALYKRGTTVTAWAKEHGLDRNIVKSWFSKGATRPIPRKWAEEIERTLGVPASKRSWSAGIKD